MNNIKMLKAQYNLALHMIDKRARPGIDNYIAELEKYKEAYLAIQFDEITGECLLGCGGYAADGHGKNCVWIEKLPKEKG